MRGPRFETSNSRVRPLSRFFYLLSSPLTLPPSLNPFAVESLRANAHKIAKQLIAGLE